MVMNCDGEVMDYDGGAVSFYEKHHMAIYNIKSRLNTSGT